MSDLTELRKQIYNSGWILSKDLFNPSNMILQARFLNDSPDTICFNLPINPTSNKKIIIQTIKEEITISKNHKIEGKIHWPNLASISLNISINALNTVKIYQDTCCISYNPYKNDIKITGLYSYDKSKREYMFMWQHAVINGIPRFIDCYIAEEELTKGLINIYKTLNSLSKIKLD